MIRTKLTHHNKSASTSTSNKSAVPAGCIKWLCKHPHLWCFKEVKSIEFLETCMCQKSHDILMCCNFICDECFLFQPDFNPLVKESPGVCVCVKDLFICFIIWTFPWSKQGIWSIWCMVIHSILGIQTSCVPSGNLT